MAKNKMSIVAYANNKYAGEGTGKCSVKINPSSYVHDHQVSYNNDQPQGAPGTTLKFIAVKPETVSFDLEFDATGAVEANPVAIATQLDQFKKICFIYNGDIHEPNYLIISWGTLIFKCKLISMNISYTYFKVDGTPLRAKVSVKFQEAISASNIAKEAGNKSPDLTHLVIVKSGDTLPLICYDVYGDSSYYIDVAKYNNIVNFRNLELGSKIFLPPIK